MVRKWRLVGFTLASTMMVSSLVFAQGMTPPPTGRNPHAGAEGRMDRSPMRPGGGGGSFFSLQGLKEALNLNEDQAKKLHDLFVEYRKGSIQKGAALQVAQLELEEMVAEPKLDLAKIEKKAKEKEALDTDLLMFRIRSLAKAKEFLSDVQFDRFRMMIEHQMMAGMMKGAGKGHGRMEMEGMGPGRGMSPHGRGGMSEMESYGEDEE